MTEVSMANLLARSILLLSLYASLAVAQESPQTPLEVPPETQRTYLVRKVAPVYPPLARQARIQGTVTLRIVINKSGDVGNIQLFSGHPMLAPAAIEAVKHWKYQPYLVEGLPVEFETQVQINFKLGKDPAPEGMAGDAPGGLPPGSIGSVAPQRVRVSSGVESGLLVSKVAPHYPPDAREQHIQGTVLLKATIDKEGSVSNLELISGHPTLAEAAIEAVKQWKYRPYLLNGNPVEVETQIQVNFTLQE
jgi:TonB family protein